MHGNVMTESLGTQTAPAFTTSCIARQELFETDWYAHMCGLVNETPLTYHRKTFEFIAACQVYYERIHRGGTCLGFAVSHEPMPAFFVSRGAEVTCTNIADNTPQAQLWSPSGQHMNRVADLPFWGIETQENLLAHCRWEIADMNHIPEHLRQGQYSYVWSSCSMEHLGGLKPGLDFLLNSTDCMAPGGWATHSTEYNVTSNTKTSNHPDLCIFTTRHFESLIAPLAERGVEMLPLDTHSGTQEYDTYIDKVPYRARGHLKLQIGPWVSTSIVLVLHKLPDAPRVWKG